MSVNKQRKGKMSLDSQNTTSVVPDINPIQEPNALPIQTALPTQTVAPVTDQTLVPIPNGLDKEKAPVIDPNEPTKDEKKSADDIDDLNDYDDLNKRWKKNQLGDIYAAQQTALTMRGKDEYDKQQKLNPKPPEQLTSMLPRQSLSVHRFLQYCNADKEGNVKKSIFLWHNVGSGKTFTSLIIALNSLDLFNENPTKNVYQPTNKPSYKKKIIIVAPGGIFVNFENELKEKLNVKLYGGLTDDEKKKSPLENTEGFNSCTWTVNGKKSKPFHLIGYRYSAIVKYIKNNTDTYVNPLKNLFADSVVIFDECHRLFRPIEPLIPTAEYFIDNGLLQNSLRCILMTGTPFNTTTTDMITMLTFMKCAVLIPPVDKKCSRIYPIEFISKTPRPTEMKEIVSTASFGILCSILNFFPGGSVLLATYNWPNKIKAYMAILHEDWQKRGLSTEQGILELLGREMNVKTMASGLFDGANNDNQAAEGFAFVNIEDFYKGLGFTEEIDNTVKETINGIFQGSSSFIKIELSEIKKYQGNYGAICELVDIINNEEIPKLNLSTDEHIIVIGKLYRYIKSLCLFVGVETFLFDFIESYILNIIKKASDATEDFVVENVTKTIAYIFTHNILLKGTSITTEQLNKIMTTVDTFCFELLQDLYSKVSTEIKNYCISIKDKEPINNVELNSDLNTRITNIIEEFLNETLNKFITLEDNISKELGVTDLVSKISKGNMASQISSGVKIFNYGKSGFNYGKSGFNFLKDGLNSSRLIIQKLKLLYGKKTVNDSITRDIEEGDFVKAGSFIIIGAGALAGVATAAKVVAVVAGAIGTVGIATPYLLAIGLGGLVVGSGIIDANGIISYLNGKEIDDVKNNDVVKVQIKNVENCIEIKDKLSEIENINNSEIENLESKIEEESENPQQHVEINYAEELERLKRERNCQSLLRLNSICTDLETIKNNFEIIFNKSWTNKIGKIFTDIDLLKQKSVQMLQSIIADKEKNNEAIRHFDLGAITGKASKNLTALVTDLIKEINQPNYVKNHDENMGFLNTAISRINNFLSNIDIELKSCFISDNFGVLFGGSTKNLPADIPELIKDSYEKLEFDEYTNDINLINKQYKLLAVKYHPDRCKLIEGESEIDKINRCNNSFAELSNAYKNVTEYFEVQNNKYYSIVHKLVFVRYANDNFTKLSKINTKMLNNSNESKNIFDDEFSDDNDAVDFFNTMIKITTSDEFINFYKKNKSELDDIAFTTLPSSEWASTTKGVIDIYKATFTESIIDKDTLIDDVIKSFTCEENIYLLEPIINQVKKFRPIPKLANPGEKVILDNFEDYVDVNSELKLITNYSETETKVGGGLIDDNPIWRFIRGQKTVSGTMSIIERIFEDESISYDSKYHSSYLVFMKSFTDYLDWNGKSLNPVALKLFYEYINFLKIKGYYDRAIDLQHFENSFLENVNYDFFSTKGLFNFMFGGNGFGDSIKNTYEKSLYKNTNIDFKKLGDALKNSFSFIDVKMPQIIIGDHSKSGNYDREENMTASKILEPTNHTIVTKKEKYNYPNSHTELMFVEYTFEQQLFFGEINCDPNPEKWWVKKVLQSEKGTPRNAMYRCIGNYSKDCDKYKAVFNGLKEVDLTNSENGNVYLFPEWKLAYAVNNHILSDEEIQKAREDREKEYKIGGKELFEFKLDDMIKKNNEQQIENIEEINEDITQVTNDSTGIISPRGDSFKGGAIEITGHAVESYADITRQFNIIPIEGDGNCLYRALQYGASGTRKKSDAGWEQLKERILQEERRVLKEYQTIEKSDKIEELNEKHIATVSQKDEYGTHLEIKAFLNLNKRFKVIVHSVDVFPLIMCGDLRKNCDEDINTGGTMNLFFDSYNNKSSSIGKNHYDVLIPKPGVKPLANPVPNPVAKPVEKPLANPVEKLEEKPIGQDFSKSVEQIVSKGEQIVSDAVSKGKELVSDISQPLNEKDSDETPSESIEKIENIRYTYSKYFFDCPKFRQILIQLIIMKTGYMYVSNKDVNGEEKIGLIEQPHLTTTEKYNAEKTNKYGVEMEFGDKDYDMRNYQELPHSNINEADYYYLPLVWSCSVEMGLNNFGFWLSELGFKYITLHPDHGGYKNELKRGLKRAYPLIKKAQTEEIKQKFLNQFFTSQSNMDTDELIEYFQSIPGIKESPICILLHPELVEGVDCVYNPSLIAMEPANTYGDYEQLCGRVLRTYPKGGFKPDETNPDKNPINKVIYQYSCYNSANLKNIMDKQFFFGEDPEYFKRTGYDIFYKNNKEVLNNIYISVQQEKNKNKVFMENILNNSSADDEKRFEDFNDLADYYFKNGILPFEYKESIRYIYDIFESFKNISEKLSDIINDITLLFQPKSDEETNGLIEKIQGKLVDFKKDLETCYSLTLSLTDVLSPILSPLKEKVILLVKPTYETLMQKLNQFGIVSSDLRSLEEFKIMLIEKVSEIKHIIIENILNVVISKMKIPNITKVVEKFTDNNVNIDVSFFENLTSGEELGDIFNTWVDYFKTASTQFSSTRTMPDMPKEMSDLINKTLYQSTKDDSSDETITIFFNDEDAYSKLVERNQNVSGQSVGGGNEELLIVVNKTKEMLRYFKPLFSDLEKFVNKNIIYLKNGIESITASIKIPEEILQNIKDIYEKFSSNEKVKTVIEYFNNVRSAIDTLYNLDYTDNGNFSSILDAVKNQENIDRLLDLIKEKNTFLSEQLIHLRDVIYPIIKSVYNNKVFQNFILKISNAYVKINNNPKIKNLRDKESAFTNSTMLNLTSKYLYNYAVDKIPFDIDLVPNYERRKLLDIFGENGIGVFTNFVIDLEHKIPPYFIRFALNDWTGNYDNYLAQYKSDLTKKLFKRKQLEFKLIKYENSEMAKLNREQFGEEKRIRNIYNMASPSFQIKGDNIDMIKLQIDKNMANLSSLAIENESPDLNKLMELRFVQQDIEIVKNYILKGDGDKEDLIGFTDLSQIENCIDSIEGPAKNEALNAIWCDPLYPNNDTLCLNTSVNKPANFVARTVHDVIGGNKTIRKKIIKNRKTIKFFNKTINKKTIKNKNKKNKRTFKNVDEIANL